MRSILLHAWLAVLVATFAAALAPAAHAAYPEKLIRIVVPFAPGGGNDILARTIAPKLAELLGQSVIVDNRPGAAGNIGSAEVARAAPDGYTLLIATNTLVINPSLYANMGLDVMKDLAPAGMIANVQFVLAPHASVPAASFGELIALAKKSPGSLNHASPGAGTPQHLAAELLNSMAGISLVHIPYRGSGPAIADLVGGQVQLGFATLPAVKPYVTASRLRALAVTGSRRSPLFPDLPTVEELGIKGYESSSWYGILAPAGTPPAILQQLANALSRTVQDKGMQAKLLAQGFEPDFREPAEMGSVMKSDLAKWARVVKQANVKVD